MHLKSNSLDRTAHVVDMCSPATVAVINSMTQFHIIEVRFVQPLNQDMFFIAGCYDSRDITAISPRISW